VPLVQPRQPSILLLRSPSSLSRSSFFLVFLSFCIHSRDHAWQCMGDDTGSYMRCGQNNWVVLIHFLDLPLLIFELLQMTSFLTRSCLVAPAMCLRQLILNTLNLLFNFSVSVHVSALYSSMLRNRVSYTSILVLGLMSLAHYILLNRFNASQAKPILLCTSDFEPPFSLNFPPR